MQATINSGDYKSACSTPLCRYQDQHVSSCQLMQVHLKKSQILVRGRQDVALEVICWGGYLRYQWEVDKSLTLDVEMLVKGMGGWSTQQEGLMASYGLFPRLSYRELSFLNSEHVIPLVFCVKLFSFLIRSAHSFTFPAPTCMTSIGLFWETKYSYRPGSAAGHTT